MLKGQISLVAALFFQLTAFAQNLQWVSRYETPGVAYDSIVKVKISNTGSIVAMIQKGPGCNIEKFNAAGTLMVNNPMGPTAIPKDFIFDNNGKVISIGHSEEFSLSSYMVVEYKDSSLNTMWSYKYGYTNGTPEYGTSIAHDATGKIIACGYDLNDGIILKFNTIGALLWTRYFNGTFNGVDAVNAVVSDNQNNIYVTGKQEVSAGNYDIFVAKYDQNGTLIYSNTYGGAGIDIGEKIQLDMNGRLVVIGSSTNTNKDIVYYRIDKNNGTVLSNGTFNGSGNGIDCASDLTIDPAGIEYVSGTTWSGTNLDFLLLKIDSVGSIVWNRSFNSIYNGNDNNTSLCFNPVTSNIYCTGYSAASILNQDYLTICYDQSGTLLQTLLQPSPKNERAKGIVADHTGAIHVFGSGWNVRDHDILHYRYGSTGNTIFSKYYYSPGRSPNTTLCVSDNNDNIYVTGVGEPAVGQGDDIYVVKFDQNGRLLKEYRFDGSYHHQDGPNDIKLDGNGHVYVVGFSLSTSNPNGILIRLDTALNFNWAARYSDSLIYTEYVDMDFDQLGNIYVSGKGPGLLTVKYDKYGNEKWRHNVPNTGASGTTVKVINNNKILSGGSDGALRINRCDSSGNFTLVSTDFQLRLAWDFIVDINNDIVACGATRHGHAFVAKFSGISGALLWTDSVTTPSTYNFYGKVGFDPLGNIIAVGMANSPVDKILVSKRNSTGTNLWTTLYTPGTLRSSVRLEKTFITNSTGDVIVTYTTDNSSTSQKIMTFAKFLSGNGSLAWNSSYVGQSNSWAGSINSSIVSNDFIMVGFSDTLNSLALCTVLRVKDTAMVMNTGPLIVNGQMGFNADPNPATESVQLKISDPKGSYELEIYNNLGELVEKKYLLGESSTIDVSKLNPGIYFFKLQNSEGENATKKIIIY